MGLPGGTDEKAPASWRLRCPDLTLGQGEPLEGGRGNQLQCSWLENPMVTRAWWAAVHKVAKKWAQLKHGDAS